MEDSDDAEVRGDTRLIQKPGAFDDVGGYGSVLDSPGPTGTPGGAARLSVRRKLPYPPALRYAGSGGCPARPYGPPCRPGADRLPSHGPAASFRRYGGGPVAARRGRPPCRGRCRLRPRPIGQGRSEERRGGKEWVSQFNDRWWPNH